MKQRLTLKTMLLYSVANCGVNMVSAFTNAALPLFLLPYGLPGWLVGLLAQERSGVGGIVQPIIGRVSDRTRTRFGRRRPFYLVGAPITALALAGLALHPPFAITLALISILALLLAVANDPYIAMMADIAPEEQRGRLGSFVGILGMGGQVVALLAMAMFWDEHQPLVTIGIGVGLVICFAITFLTVPEPPIPAAAPKEAAHSPTGGVPIVRYLKDVFSYREVAKYSVAMAFFWLGGGAASPFLTRFGVAELGVSEQTAFILVMLLVLGTGVFAFPAGLLGDRWGKKRVMSVGLAFFAVAIIIGSQARTMEQLLVAILFVSLGNTIPFVLNYPMLTDLIPQERAGEFVGLGSMLWSIGQPVGALLGGALFDVTGGYRVTFIFSGLMMIAAFVALQQVRPPTRSTAQVPEPPFVEPVGAIEGA